jgi:hypothetical protein
MVDKHQHLTQPSHLTQHSNKKGKIKPDFQILTFNGKADPASISNFCISPKIPAVLPYSPNLPLSYSEN